MALETWNVDSAHSSIAFVVRHMVVSKVRGHFTRWTAKLEVDEANLAASRVSVEIDATSIDTREAKRDAHLRSADFLDADTHPKLTFASKRLEPGKGDRFKVVGDLTIRGVTREVALDVEKLGTAKDPFGNVRTLFSAATSINRLDFGAKWNAALEAGGVLVSEKVDIEVEIQAIHPAAA